MGEPVDFITPPYINKTGFVILSESPEFLLGVLCSRLMDYYYRHEFPAWGDPWKGGRVQFRGDRMKAVPIVDHDATLCQEIANTVTQILKRKQSSQEYNVSELENKLDLIAYKLYGLSYNEVLLIEPEFRLSNEAYDDFHSAE